MSLLAEITNGQFEIRNLLLRFLLQKKICQFITRQLVDCLWLFGDFRIGRKAGRLRERHVVIITIIIISMIIVLMEIRGWRNEFAGIVVHRATFVDEVEYAVLRMVLAVIFLVDVFTRIQVFYQRIEIGFRKNLQFLNITIENSIQTGIDRFMAIGSGFDRGGVGETYFIEGEI